ncbi:MAG: calcium/sodium antiporter [Eubacteriales bacterium]|nr:calcium/sodium antiporter [Eubacteriales bacterium]
MEILIQVVLLIAGFVMLIKGADWFVDGASKIADRLGVPQLVIGLTIVAFGTSVPEAAVSISAALKGSAGLSVGNVLGSNILNILIILGSTSVICPVPVQKSTVRYEIPYVILISFIMSILGLSKGYLNWIDGLILWVFMIIYLLYLVRMTKNGTSQPEDTPRSEEGDTFLRMILSIIIGLGLVVLGSDFAVDAASKIATIFGMSERLIGLTIVALGTSLPELVTSVTAAMKGKADIAIGNIVGSNIFNILFVLGTSALIIPLTYASGFIIDSIMAIFSAALLLLCVLGKQKLTRSNGIIMLVCYAAYFVYLIL